MSVGTLQQELRAGAAKRDALVKKLAELREREAAADSARDLAEKAAEDAQRAFRERLAAQAMGEPLDLTEARASRDAAVAWFDERVLACAGIEPRIEEAEREVEAARKAAAARRERLAVAVAGQLNLEFRASAKVVADARLRWLRSAAAASEARHDATGRVGEEPVSYTPRNSLARELLADLPAPELVRGFSEAELLAVRIDEEDEAPVTPRAVVRD